LVVSDDNLHIGYDANGTGNSALTFRSGSDNTTSSVVRMHLDDDKFFIDTDTLYVDTVNDRVGVNMTPSYTLDVGGSARFNSPVGINNVPPNGAPVWLEVTGDVQVNSQFRGSNQSAASPTYSFTNDLTSGMWYTGTDLNFSVGGAARLNIAANGVISAQTANYDTLISADGDFITKKYADDNNDLAVKIVGDTMTGPLILNANPSVALGASTKQYVDTATTNVKQGFYIDIAATGIANAVPAGWTSSRTSAGVYVITHNLNTSQLGYSLAQMDAGVFAVSWNIIARTVNDFTIRFGGGVDTAFGGMVFA